MLWPCRIFDYYLDILYLMAVWYILWPFDIFYPVFGKNLATLFAMHREHCLHLARYYSCKVFNRNFNRIYVNTNKNRKWSWNEVWGQFLANFYP
jgi:hypothetical protein